MTTLLDHHTDPADRLVALYHERWETEVAFLALKDTLFAGRLLRSTDPAWLEQELWALLTVYQSLRQAMTDAVESCPGTDPDRASFTIALHTAAAQVIAAENIVGPVDEAGAIPVRSWPICFLHAGAGPVPAWSSARCRSTPRNRPRRVRRPAGGSSSSLSKSVPLVPRRWPRRKQLPTTPLSAFVSAPSDSCARTGPSLAHRGDQPSTGDHRDGEVPELVHTDQPVGRADHADQGKQRKIPTRP